MRRCPLLFAAGLLSAITAFAAAPVIVKGQLKDPAGQPIRGGRITLVAYGPTHTDSVEQQELQTAHCVSNKKGLFGASIVRSRQYRLQIYAEGFHRIDKTIHPDYTQAGRIFSLGTVELEPLRAGGAAAVAGDRGAPPAEAKAAAPSDSVSEARAEIRRLIKRLDRAADLEAINSARGKLAAGHLCLACLQLGTDLKAARVEARSARDLAIANSSTHLRAGQLLTELGKPDGPEDNVKAAVCDPP